MMFTRRTLFALATAVTIGSEAADACSFVVTPRPVGFSDAACRRSLERLIGLINEASRLSDEALTKRAEALSIIFDADVTDPILNFPNRSPIEDGELLRAWTRSDGTPDRVPLRLTEVNLLKSERGYALYQFTLLRERFVAEVTEEQASTDSCGIPAPAHFETARASYIGVFRNNRLRTVSAFEEWLGHS